MVIRKKNVHFIIKIKQVVHLSLIKGGRSINTYGLFLDNLNDVFILHDVTKTNSLGAKLGTGSPDKSILAVVCQSPVNRVTSVLDCYSAAQNDSVRKVWGLTGLLSVHPNKSQFFPQHLQQVVQVELHFTGDHNVALPSGQPVYFFKRNLVNLVINVQAGHINPVIHDNINKLVHADILSEENLRVVDLVLSQNHADHFLV